MILVLVTESQPSTPHTWRRVVVEGVTYVPLTLNASNHALLKLNSHLDHYHHSETSQEAIFATHRLEILNVAIDTLCDTLPELQSSPDM